MFDPNDPALRPPPLPVSAAPGPQDRKWLWIALLGVGSVVSLGVIYATVGDRLFPPRRAVDKGRQAGLAAFNGPPADINSPEVKAIRAVFDKLNQAAKKEDGKALVALFDIDRLAENANENRPDSVGKEFLRGFAKGFSDSMVEKGTVQFRWDHFQIGGCHLAENGNDALVYVRLWSRFDKSPSHVRYWFTRSSDEWRIYDYEIIEGGLRIGTIVACASPGNNVDAKLKAVQQELQKFAFARSALSEDDNAIAQHTADSIDVSNLPSEYQSLVNFLKGEIDARGGRDESALAHFADVEAKHFDIPTLNLFRAKVRNRLKSFDQAKADAEAFLERFNGDAQGYFELGLALAGLNKIDEARAAFGKSLDDDPDDVKVLVEFATRVPRDKKSEVGERFAKMTKPAEEFKALIDKLREKRDEGSRAAVVAAMKKIDPNRPEVVMADAWSEYGQKRYAEAAALAKNGWTRSPDPQQKLRFQELFLTCHLAARTTVAGYRESFDALGAFEYLAEDLVDEDRRAELSDLIAAHAEKHAGDPMLLFYRGELASANENWDEAVNFYRDGLAKANATLTKTKQENRDSFQSQLVYAFYKAGKASQALATLRPRDKTFEQLAQYTVNDGDPAALESLLADQRKALKNDHVFPRWEAELLWLKRDYAGVAGLLPANRAAFEKYEYRYYTLLIRSLLHQQKYADAEEAVKGNPNKFDQRYYPILIAAGQGNVEETIAAMQAALDQKSDCRWRCYTDDMLAPILARDAFAPFREKFPDPRKTAAAGTGKEAGTDKEADKAAPKPDTSEDM